MPNRGLFVFKCVIFCLQIFLSISQISLSADVVNYSFLAISVSESHPLELELSPSLKVMLCCIFFGALQLLAVFAIKFQNALIVDVNCFF